MKRSLLLALGLALGLAMVASQSAAAHSFIDACTPEVGSTVKQAPNEVRCTFTEPIDAKQTVFSVSDAKGNKVDKKDLKADTNDSKGLTVVISLDNSKTPNGVYTVKWSTVSQDGDSTDGQWQFAVGTEGVPSVSIVSPTMDATFDKDPSDVVVTIKPNNFQPGQGGRRWQVSLDEKVMTQVTDATTTTTLKAVPKGDHRLDVALLTDDKTIVATSGMHLQIGAADQMNAAPTAAPAAPLPAPATTENANLSTVLALVLGLLVIVVIGVVVFFVRRKA